MFKRNDCLDGFAPIAPHTEYVQVQWFVLPIWDEDKQASTVWIVTEDVDGGLSQVAQMSPDTADRMALELRRVAAAARRKNEAPNND